MIEDDASDSTQGITAFEKLINQDQVSVILGPTLSNTAFSTNPIAQDAGVPVLGLSNTAEGITEIATTCPRLAHRGAGDPRNGPGDQESLGLETLALLFGDDDAFTQSGADVFRQALEDEGVTIATEQTFAKADTDFSARLTEARNRRSPRGSMAYGDRRQLEGREILATMIIEEDLQLGAWHQGQHLRSGLEDVFRRFSVLANRRAARRQPVRRGAGDARDRACAARPPQGPAARRALDGAGAVDGRRGLPGDQARPRGRHGAADRAERPAPLAAAATGYVMETGEIARPAPPRSCCRTPGWWRPTSARSFD